MVKALITSLIIIQKRQHGEIAGSTHDAHPSKYTLDTGTRQRVRPAIVNDKVCRGWRSRQSSRGGVRCRGQHATLAQLLAVAWSCRGAYTWHTCSAYCTCRQV